MVILEAIRFVKSNGWQAAGLERDPGHSLQSQGSQRGTSGLCSQAPSSRPLSFTPSTSGASDHQPQFDFLAMAYASPSPGGYTPRLTPGSVYPWPWSSHLHDCDRTPSHNLLPPKASVRQQRGTSDVLRKSSPTLLPSSPHISCLPIPWQELS